VAYTPKFSGLADAARSRVESVSAADVDTLVSNGAVVLDIRDPDEHAVDHISTAINVSRGKLEMNIEETIPDLDTTVLCYCNANNRGALSADTLRAMGFRNARYIEGGLTAYRALKPA
jgi:rhodanese-related sulfurtransferase